MNTVLFVIKDVPIHENIKIDKRHDNDGVVNDLIRSSQNPNVMLIHGQNLRAALQSVAIRAKCRRICPTMVTRPEVINSFYEYGFMLNDHDFTYFGMDYKSSYAMPINYERRTSEIIIYYDFKNHTGCSEEEGGDENDEP